MKLNSITLILLVLSTWAAQAHKLSDSYLSLDVRGGRLIGRWDLALRDLEYAVGLDANEDGKITWGELRASQPAIASYALARLGITANGLPVPVQMMRQMVDSHTDGSYAVLFFEGQHGPALANITINYQALFDLDPSHRGLFHLEWDGYTQQAIFSPEHPCQRFDLQTSHRGREFLAFITEGVWHIWLGYDHILFLVALLLPAVLKRHTLGWHGVREFRPALLNVLRVVTAFTVAHSVTLSLASLGLVRMPSRLVESLIAASVVLAAANNLRPTVGDRSWMVAFAFGLIHGFGFASALTGFGLTRSALALGLVGFNLGVEIGQMAIVAIFLPTTFLVREFRFYRQFTIRFGSAGIMLLASIWMAERMFNLRWLPF